jgi:chromosome segregation ATPase
MGITAENVHAAADRIAEAGQQPTLAAVRAALGGGSFTTISESMKAWKAARQSAAIPILQEAPQAVTDRLTALGGEVWALALGMANDRLAKEREALEASRQEVEAQRREAAELADQMSFELEAARAQIDQQADALRRAQEQASQLAVAQAVLAEVQKRADGLAALLEQERNATQIVQAKAEAAIAEAANLAGKLSVSQVPKSQTKKSSAP